MLRIFADIFIFIFNKRLYTTTQDKTILLKNMEHKMKQFTKKLTELFHLQKNI